MDATSIVNTLSEISDKPSDEIKVSTNINIRESHAVALGKIPKEMRNVVWQKSGR
jgi:capsular polysaccharide biosynthesis protein